MRYVNVKALFLPVLLAAVACGDPTEDKNPTDGHTDGDGNSDTPTGGKTLEITQNVGDDKTWEKKNVYHLKNHVFVIDGATLTIEAGTKVIGDNGSSLVVTQNGRLVAEGTAAEPIVFTSSKAVGARRPGDWGGVVLLGDAPINVSGGTNAIEGFPAGTDNTQYGGTDAAHNCGTIRYARIEFAGFQLAPNNELNGLTVGGCGSETKLDHIQVHRGADDGIEFFGGNVGITHAVVTQANDDGLDWDFGWAGKVQFFIVQQSAVDGNMGIEADNNGNAMEAEPRSNPEIWNMTLVGSSAAPGSAATKQGGMHLRRGTAGELNNVIVAKFADLPVDVGDESTAAQCNAGDLFIKNSIFFKNGGNEWPAESSDNDGGFDEASYFLNESTNRSADPKLTAASDLSNPNFKPAADSPALTGAGTPPAGFDTTATFVGAIGSTDWTTGWTSYPAN